MIAVISSHASQKQLDNLVDWLEGKGLGVNVSVGSEATILGLIGDTSRVDVSLLESIGIIEKVTRVSEPFKAANRKFHPADTAIDVGMGVTVGGGSFNVFAGPTAVEGEGFLQIARAAKESGATVLRGNAFLVRKSPYASQGMGEEALEILKAARSELSMPIMTEICDIRQVELFARFDVDILQVGSQNVQNFNLLKEVGMSGKPVLLRRGAAMSVDELLMSAEYVMSEGNANVILCERGVRSFGARASLDLSAVPVLRHLTHLPVVVDPSSCSGHVRFVEPMALAAVAAGADGLMIEVHDDPESAWAEGSQAMLPDQFGQMMPKIEQIRDIVR